MVVNLIITNPRGPGGAVRRALIAYEVGVRPSSSSAEGRLGRPCHPGRGLVWAKPEIPWLT
jgi:hypothetical protein